MGHHVSVLLYVMIITRIEDVSPSQKNVGPEKSILNKNFYIFFKTFCHIQGKYFKLTQNGNILKTFSLPFYPRRRPGTHCTEGWVGPRAGLDRCGKSRPHRDWIPEHPARSQSLDRLSYPGPPGDMLGTIFNLGLGVHLKYAT
jgi:hypothetical protein